jgi:hypothetical protein
LGVQLLVREASGCRMDGYKKRALSSDRRHGARRANARQSVISILDARRDLSN